METPPDIHLHIDRLILDGLPFGFADAGVIEAALKAEIGRILGENFTGQPCQSAAVNRLAALALSFDTSTAPGSFGRAVAGTLGTALFAGFAPTSPDSSP